MEFIRKKVKWHFWIRLKKLCINSVMSLKMLYKPTKILITKFLKTKNVYFSPNKLNSSKAKEYQWNKFTNNNSINLMKSNPETISSKENVINFKQNLSSGNKDYHFIRQKIDHYPWKWISQFSMILNRKDLLSLLKYLQRDKGQESLLMIRVRKNPFLKIMKLKTKFLTIAIFKEVNITKRLI